jgi:hypothetical protein
MRPTTPPPTTTDASLTLCKTTFTLVGFLYDLLFGKHTLEDSQILMIEKQIEQNIEKNPDRYRREQDAELFDKKKTFEFKEIDKHPDSTCHNGSKEKSFAGRYHDLFLFYGTDLPLEEKKE